MRIWWYVHSLSRPSLTVRITTSHFARPLTTRAATMAAAASSPSSAPFAFHDSLSKKVKPFEKRPDGREITLYCCGPTVYAPTHLGHVRMYTTQDYLRRIIVYYFKQPMRMVMNFTDVDDKIIRNARQEFLYERYALQPATEQLSIAEQALESAKVTDPLIDLPRPTTSTAATDIYRSVISAYLDVHQGATIDYKHEIFLKVTQRYEKEFIEDMHTMNVMDPDKYVRVTESMDLIIKFIQQIQQNGYAYETPDNSVYFDIIAFEKAGHTYARLEPSSKDNTALQKEAEGALTTETTKRSKNDFALWKASKAGEPSWPSPWGPGRPGWHIECSAMACNEFGQHLDIHSGGIDLAFPHHDNELAQTEGHFSKRDESDKAIDDPWVESFLHVGHLHIKGAKMSKSLKNFVTIRQALAQGEYTAEVLRIVFLSSQWRDTMEVTDGVIEWAKNWEMTVDVLFRLAQNLQWQQDSSIPHSAPATGNDSASTDVVQAIKEALSTAKDEVDQALRDSFDTRATLESIAKLINSVNATIQKDVTTLTGAGAQQIIETAQWVNEIIQILGLIRGVTKPQPEEIGWHNKKIPQSDLLAVSFLARVRHAVRSVAIAKKSGLPAESVKEPTEFLKEITGNPPEFGIKWKASITEVYAGLQSLDNNDMKTWLSLADVIRDKVLWNAGYYVEDTTYPSLPYLIRVLDISDITARDEADARARAKEEAKIRRAADEARKLAEEAEKAKIDPKDMFRTSEYSAWDDETGLPTKKADGGEVSKAAGKKLKKEQDTQRKLWERFQKLST